MYTWSLAEAYLHALSDGVEGGEVGVDGGDVAEEGGHGGVVVVLPRQPRVHHLLPRGDRLGLQMRGRRE